MKICPKCGSTEIIPSLGGIIGRWKCEKCGFSGTIFPEVEKLGEENNEVKKGKKSKTKRK